MKGIELAKAFNPVDFEDEIYGLWLSKESFAPKGEGSPFVIVIPPPNVTGVLHMGHGLNNILQDILVRYYRMEGRPALWVPGTDHAGIATQNVVERKLRERGIDRQELGREKFIEETWKVKEEHHKTIVRQLQKIGASCDWSRERFTLDAGLSKAVREVFVSLFERGLIYRGNYLVNWCSSCGTALSDDEVEHHEVQGKLTHIRYPFVGGGGAVEVATTRPETMLGDTAVAVHPEDPRYGDIIGKEVKLPLTERSIPVIADEMVDKEFGTGAVKVTPAHDQNDWEVSERSGIEKINILRPDGRLNGNVPKPYQNLTVWEARKRVVEDLKDGGFFIREEEHVHQIGHCYRCDTVVEPFLSEQWFVRMKPLAEKALKALEDDDIRFYPKKWENTYIHWLDNIRDWCISRQLWWGHRIPVWYCDDCGEMTALREDPETCPACGSSNIRQDEDVLDTWFSSWLWPFSTLGWPDITEDLKTYFPTSALVTAYDIIFFWVSRMIMAGMEFMGEAPFRDIYIHGLIRDKQGRKMSKSLGNGIDPIEIVEEYGADALKFTLTFLAAQGQDILIDKDSFKLGSKFANKIWNAARYLLMNLEGRELLPPEEIEPEDVDRWIYHRLNEAVKAVNRGMQNYRFNDAAQGVYEFFWNDFCDWYIEASKLNLYHDDEQVKNKAATLLMQILEESLRLLHPFLSFITEEIYQKLPNTEGLLITSRYPKEDPGREDFDLAEKFESLQELVREVRTLRSEFTIPPSSTIRVHVRTDPGFFATDFLQSHHALIADLMQASELGIAEKGSKDEPELEGSVPVPGKGFTAFVYVKDVIDVPKEIEKLKKEREKLESKLVKVEKKLTNSQFLERAPGDIIEKEKNIRRELTGKLEKIGRHLKDLV
jgi:valyl-tRNA synthetase